MEQKPTTLNRFTELVNLKRIENDLWNTLEKHLQDAKTYGYLEQVNLKPLVKSNKSINNLLLKMIVKTTEESRNAINASTLPTTDDEVKNKEIEPDEDIIVENA